MHQAQRSRTEVLLENVNIIKNNLLDEIRSQARKGKRKMVLKLSDYYYQNLRNMSNDQTTRDYLDMKPKEQLFVRELVIKILKELDYKIDDDKISWE